jgi:hypothetical protein
MTVDPAAVYERLKTETAGMFGYDLADLSLTQGLQIDLVSLLRLEVDTMQGKVLAGETVDLQRLVAAHGLLQKMLPAQALVAPAAAASHDAFAGAREELERFLAGRASAIAHRDERLAATKPRRWRIFINVRKWPRAWRRGSTGKVPPNLGTPLVQLFRTGQLPPSPLTTSKPGASCGGFLRGRSTRSELPTSVRGGIFMMGAAQSLRRPGRRRATDDRRNCERATSERQTSGHAATASGDRCICHLSKGGGG